MADFSREKAKTRELYQRKALPGGDKYIKVPFDIVSFDDNSGDYIQPVSVMAEAKTWSDNNTDATDAEFLILDVVPFQGVTEIR